MAKLKKLFSIKISDYLIAVFICLFFLIIVMRLWEADLRVPFTIGGDATAAGALIKGTINNGWYTSNPFLGAPFHSNLYAYPLNWNLDMLFMKIISLVFPNWAVTMNLYYLLSFPLIVIAALFVFKKMGVSSLLAVFGSLLYAFIPYHFMRGEIHLYFSTYFLIPLIILVIFWIFEDNILLNQFSKNSPRTVSSILNWKNLFCIIVCVGLGSSHIYYPFFACFFLLIAGICAAFWRKRWMPLLNSGLLIGIVILCILAWNIPTLIYQYQNGTNVVLAARNPEGSEIYGLKIIQLLLPIQGHRISWLSNFADRYAQTAPLVNENTSASLGFIGSIGFIILIIWAFYGFFNKSLINGNETFKKIHQLSALNLAAVLFATIGGFGTIIAYLGLPQIRSYNRISIFIAFFSIMTVVLLIDLLIQKYSFLKIKKWLIFVCVIVVLCLAIGDQTSPNFIPNYKSNQAEFQNDEQFVNNIEKTSTSEMMVFQLPYMSFPENGSINMMLDYDPLIGYLHSTKIHWSYGSMRGSEGDLWQKQIANEPVPEMLQRLSFAGFNGIYLDTFGYEDKGKEIISSISTGLGVTPLISNNKRLYYFDMSQYNAQLKSQYTPEEYEKLKNETLNLIDLSPK